MGPMKRRRFLCGLGAVGTVAGLSASGWLANLMDPTATEHPDRGHRDIRPVRAFRKTAWAMGAMVSMTLLHRDESAAGRALDAAFAELDQVEKLMSIYRPDSQLSRLNRERVLPSPHPYLLDVLQSARNTSEASDGAFDITIQPLWELYSTARNAGRLPSESEVARARERVDWRRVEFDSRRVRLRGRGTRITLNGIAQGYAADRVRATLRDHGVEHALVDTGEISALGAKPGREGWRVGIQHPRHADAFLSLTRLAGQCLATSGDYATTFSADRDHHHLFDPRSGHSPTELASVSIAAQTAVAADSLSTAVFVLGLDAGAALIDRTDGVSAMLVTKSGRVVVTPGFPLA